MDGDVRNPVCRHMRRVADIDIYSDINMKTLEEALRKKYPKYAERIMRSYEAANGCEMTWESITKLRLTQFVAAMKGELASNSVKTYAAMVRAVLYMYSEEHELPKDFAKALHVKREQAVSTWLTDDEIALVVAYEPKNDTEATVRDHFVLGCLTGARWSDYSRFSEGNINGDSLVYISRKTSIRSEIPLSPAVERILRGHRATVAANVTPTTFNETIRRICRACGITRRVSVYHGGELSEGEKWEFVSSHTARRSFATNLYLRCHDIFRVARYMGHASVDMTASYILSIGDAPEEVRQYFDKFR